MLSLQEGKHSVKICDLVTGKHKLSGVYFHPDECSEHMNHVDDVGSLLSGHTNAAKSRLRVNQESIDDSIKLLQGGHEPDEECTAPVAKAFWHFRELKHELLTRSMDLRDQSNQRFEINIPKKLDVFWGHVAVLGPTGSGKGWWICNLIKRHWQRATMLNRRKVYYISAEATIDKTLEILKIRRFEDWFVPIDISYEAGEASGKTPEDFWQSQVGSVISNARNAIVVLDDSQDGYAPREALRSQDRLCRIGRHRNISVISIFHSIRSGLYTRQLCQSSSHIVLFSKAQAGRVRDFFTDVIGLKRREAAELVKLMNKCGRASVIRVLAPVCVICEKYLKLL